MRTLSPQYERPSNFPSPVAMSRFPVLGSTTTPDRAQIAEPLSGQLEGANKPDRFEHREFQRPAIRLDPAAIATTWP